MSLLPRTDFIHDDGTVSQSNWKPIMVAAFSAIEKELDGLPIPAAKTCIWLVLQVIEAGDVAADDEKVLRQLHAQYQLLSQYLLLLPAIFKTVADHLNDLDLKLKRLAELWGPRLTKPRERDILPVLRLFTASKYRNPLLAFVTETDKTIADFLRHFQASQHIANSTMMMELSVRADLVLMPQAPSAFYNSVRPDRAGACLAGTRQTVFKTIDKWALNMDADQPPLFWLNGLAGIGKTTIAYTFASLLDKEHQLGGSFFCLHSHDQREDARLVFPTLALQLSEIDPIVKRQLAEVFRNDSSCLNQLSTQFEKLILHPMSAISLSKPLVVIIDALDECQPSNFTAEMLRILVSNIAKIPFLRVFITSRPEAHIREALGIKGGTPVYQKLVLHENMGVQQEVEEDIRHYLKIRLQEVWNSRDESGEWPSPEDLEILVKQSGKLFVYAATTVHFIKKSFNVDRQLRNLLEHRKNRAPNSDVEPYLHLDQLYLTILEAAFALMDTKDIYYNVRFQNIVGSIVLMQEALPMRSLATFLGDYNVDDIKNTLYHLHSIFIVPDEPSQAPRAYHLAFPNFITSAGRCTNSYAFINPQKQELYLFLRCLDVMEKFFGPTAKLNQHFDIQQDTICPLEGGTVVEGVARPSNNPSDESIDDFYEWDSLLSPDVRYSNNHWYSHLVNICVKPGLTEELLGEGDVLPAAALEQLMSGLEQLINNCLPHWLYRRIVHISSTTGATKIKLAQTTFDIIYKTHCWMAANIDSQKTPGMSQILTSVAHKAFTRLFPTAAKDYNYLGVRLNRHNTGEVIQDPVVVIDKYLRGGYLPNIGPGVVFKTELLRPSLSPLTPEGESRKVECKETGVTMRIDSTKGKRVHEAVYQ